MQEVFTNELTKEEKLLWSGQPDPSIIFSKADIFLVPFSILWGGFAIVWEFLAMIAVFTQTNHSTDKMAILIFPLFGIPFVLIGLYFMVGRFIVKKLRKQKTFYAVTNKRVLIITKFFGENLQAEYINSLPSINKSIRPNGFGTITFGNASLMDSLYGNTGMEFFISFYSKTSPAFYDIKDANAVYDIVKDVKNKQTTF